ncbi:hypothetical protein BH10BAC6_BH10BAC6_07900 [soil metagenome]
MRITRWILAGLIGTVLIMGFDCKGDNSQKKCDLRVKAKYTDSLKPKYTGQLSLAKNATIGSLKITVDSAFLILGYHEPMGLTLPGLVILSVNDSTRAGSVSPDFTDAGVGNLISKAGMQGPMMVDCVRDQLLLTTISLLPFEAQDPMMPAPWTCGMNQFCMWNMTANQLEKWSGTPDNVKMDFFASLNVYRTWMSASGRSGKYILRNLRFGTTNNAPYRSVTVFNYVPFPANPNNMNFVVTLND